MQEVLWMIRHRNARVVSDWVEVFATGKRWRNREIEMDGERMLLVERL